MIAQSGVADSSFGDSVAFTGDERLEQGSQVVLDTALVETGMVQRSGAAFEFELGERKGPVFVAGDADLPGVVGGDVWEPPAPRAAGDGSRTMPPPSAQAVTPELHPA